MKPIHKGILLIIVTYLATLVVTAVILLITFALLDPKGCNSFGQALLVMWGLLAALFLLSVTVVGVVAWKVLERMAGRLVVIAIHGTITFASFLVIAFGLLIAFNC